MFENLLQSNVFKSGTNLLNNALNFGSWLLAMLMSNPLLILGGLILLRVSQKGFKFNLSDLLGIKL